jgi:uncharacterized protein YpuA (DUF1002 family)
MNRQEIESKYNFTLTDNQFRIIQAEITDKEIADTDSQVVDDSMANLAYLEAEYAWWENQVALAQAEK